MKLDWSNGDLLAEPERSACVLALVPLWQSSVDGWTREEHIINDAGSTLPSGTVIHSQDGVTVGKQVAPRGIMVDLRYHDSIIGIQKAL
jgi:hypothetical protein